MLETTTCGEGPLLPWTGAGRLKELDLRSDAHISMRGHVPNETGLPKRAGPFLFVSQSSSDDDRREGDHEQVLVGIVLHPV